MGRLLSLLTGWKGYAALGLACFVAGFFTEWRLSAWHDAYKEKTQIVKTVQVIERQGKITFTIGMDFEAARLNNAEATRKRQEEVLLHVTPEIDRDYPVPCGFVRVFQSATHGPIPDPAGCPDDATSAVTLSAIGHVETENAGQYDQLAEQLKALQEWIRQQQQVK